MPDGDAFAEWPEGFYMTPSEVDEMLAPFGGDAWMFANDEEVPDYMPSHWAAGYNTDYGGAFPSE